MNETGIDSSDASSRERPGKALNELPIEINGHYYDPTQPPELVKLPDGTRKYIGGREINKDEAYSMFFWSKNQPRGLRDSMLDTIRRALASNSLDIFVSATKNSAGTFELDKSSKEKISAYRILALELGYKIGPASYKESVGVVTAPIEKM